jgi:hypothetical protein
MPPKKSSGSMGGGDGLVFPVVAFLLTGAYYFLSAQAIIKYEFVSPDVQQMPGIMVGLVTWTILATVTPGCRIGNVDARPTRVALTLRPYPLLGLHSLPAATRLVTRTIPAVMFLKLAKKLR